MSFPDGWTHKWAIDINADSVIGSPITDWPCLLTDAHFPATAWAQMQATGADLRFSSDEAGSSELYYDDPRLDVAGQEAHLYVRVPVLASGVDTRIWGWVGNAGASAPSAAWKQNTYVSTLACIVPIEEGTGATVGDRTTYGNDGAIVNATWESTSDGAFHECLHVAPGVQWPVRFASPIPSNMAWKGADDHTVQVVWMPDVGSYGNNQNVVANRTSNSNFTTIRGDDANPSLQAGAKGDTTEWRIDKSNQVVVDELLITQLRWDGAAKQATVDHRGNRWTTTKAIPDGDALYGDRWFLGGRDNTESLDGKIMWAAWWDRRLSDDEIAISDLMLSDPATWATAGALEAVGGGPRPLLRTVHLGHVLVRGETL